LRGEKPAFWNPRSSKEKRRGGNLGLIQKRKKKYASVKARYHLLKRSGLGKHPGAEKKGVELNSPFTSRASR